MPEEATDISFLVKEFMKKPLWRGQPIKGWLYLGLPQALDVTLEMYDEECNKTLKELATISGNKSMTSLNLRDGSLSRRYDEVRKECDNSLFTGGSLQLFEKINRRKGAYERFSEDKMFLSQLLETLKQLEDGVPPTTLHQSDIEEAILRGHHFFRELMSNKPWVSEKLQPEYPEITYKEIKKFLETLQNRLSVVTGVVQVFKTEESRAY